MGDQDREEEDRAIEVAHQRGHTAIEEDRQQQADACIQKDREHSKDDGVAVGMVQARIRRKALEIFRADVGRVAPNAVLVEADAQGLDQGVGDEDDKANQRRQDEKIGSNRFA